MFWLSYVLDEWLIDLAAKVDLVYSSPVDSKEYPEGVDLVLVEGAVANAAHLEMICTVRERSHILLSFGDCAVTGNVTALRNPLGGAATVLQYCGYTVDPTGIVPQLLDRVVPVHYVVPIDIYLPGCPPSAARIKQALEPLLQGEKLVLAGREMIKFG